MTRMNAALAKKDFWTQAILVLMGTALIALAAKITIPFFPVPMTLQTLAVLFIGFAYGARLGAITVSVYLLEGLMGLPVFSNTTPAGPAAFVGPTAGFLVGFVFMAALAGYVTDKGLRALWALVPASLCISALLYVPGLLWPWALAGIPGIEANWIGLSLDQLFAVFVMPFVLGDVIKALLAAVLVAGWYQFRRSA